MLLKIPGNAQEDSGECSWRYREMLLKIAGKVAKDYGECSRGFQGMFGKILGNVQEDSKGSKFRLISWNFDVELPQNNGKKQLLSNSSKENIFFTSTYNESSELNYYFSYLTTFCFPFLSFLCWGKRVISVRRCKGIKKL